MFVFVPFYVFVFVPLYVFVFVPLYVFVFVLSYVFVFVPGSCPSIASLRSRICICAFLCSCICVFIVVCICAFICVCICVCFCAGILTIHCFLEVSLGGHGCAGGDYFGSCSNGDDGRGLDIGGDDDNGGRVCIYANVQQ